MSEVRPPVDLNAAIKAWEAFPTQPTTPDDLGYCITTNPPKFIPPKNQTPMNTPVPSTVSDTDVLEYAKWKFEQEYEAKFRAGMAKYKAPIINKDCANEAFQEVWDLLSYIATIKLQHKRCVELLEELGNSFVVKDYGLTTEIDLREDSRFQQIISLLSPKPLAVKKAQ